jgi:DNA-binding response OmpR family regulator
MDPSHAPTILVVEATPDLRDAVVAGLVAAGYRAIGAGTGDRALRLLEGDPAIALIFTDLLMPGLDGFKLADMAKLKRPDIKIIYTTDSSHLADTTLGIAHGEILFKPYRLDELERLVREALV